MGFGYGLLQDVIFSKTIFKEYHVARRAREPVWEKLGENALGADKIPQVLHCATKENELNELNPTKTLPQQCLVLHRLAADSILRAVRL